MLISSINKVRGEMGLFSTKEGIFIADVFKRQRAEPVKKLILDNHGKMVPLSKNMTSNFQPLDLTVSYCCKTFLRNKGQIWYSEEVQQLIFVYYHTKSFHQSDQRLQTSFKPLILLVWRDTLTCMHALLSVILEFYVRQFVGLKLLIHMNGYCSYYSTNSI